MPVAARDSACAREGDAKATRILVVDDEPGVRRLCRDQLAAAGYRVEQAESGEAALRALRESARPIDLVLSDVSMPEMDGVELERRLLQEQPGLKILFMSAGMEPSGDAAIEPHRLLRKPFSRTELLARVRALLGPAIRPDLP